MRLRLALAGVVALLIACASLAAWHTVDRTGFIASVCRAGLPNLSRPAVIDADVLRCDVLGRRQTLSGYLFTDFEASYFTIGERVVVGPDGFENESAWFSGTRGLSQRGGADLSQALAVRRPGLCGGRLAKIVAEGWMTKSPGEYGHLGIAEREFYADRIVAVSAPSTEELEPFRLEVPPDLAEMCEQRESSNYDGL